MPGFESNLGDFSGSFSFTPANLGQSSTTRFGGLDPFSVGLSFLSDALGYHRQKKLMDKQYSQSLEQWNRQNEYNSPAAQIRRLQEAGLNPDLAYSQLGNGSPAQMMSTEQNVGQHDYGSVLQRSKEQRIAMERLQLDNELARSTISLNESEAEKNRAQARYATSGADWNYRRITSQQIIDDLNKSQIPVNDAQARVLESRVNEIAANIDLLIEKADNTRILSDIAAIDKEFKSDWWRAQIAEMRSEARLNDKQCEKLEQVILEMKDSWATRFKDMQHDERINYSREVMAMAQAAVNKWQYTLDEDGNPVPTKGGAAYHALDLAIGLIGRIFQVNANEFTNHSSWSERRGKNFKVRTAD